MFRFTIRDLLWLMVVVAGGLAWVVDHSRQRSKFDELVVEFNCLQVGTGHSVEKLPDGRYKVSGGPITAPDGSSFWPAPKIMPAEGP